MYIKVLAVILIILGGAFCGINSSEKLRKRTLLCRDIRKMLRICETAIRCSEADVYRIMLRLRDEDLHTIPFLENLSAVYDSNADFHTEWKRAVMEAGGLADDERQLLADFGDTLGTSDTEGQLKAISAYQEAVRELYEKRCSEYMKKGKLYRSLGLLAGLTLGIIVI